LTTGGKSGRWYGPEGGAISTSVGLLNSIDLVPLFLPKAVTIDRIAISVSAVGGATSVTRLGVYASDTDLWPAALVADFGTVATGSGDGTGQKEITVSQSIGPGLVWLFLRPETDTVPTYRGMTSTYTSVVGTTAVPTVSSGSTMLRVASTVDNPITVANTSGSQAARPNIYVRIA
jgi:hypothetical protein